VLGKIKRGLKSRFVRQSSTLQSAAAVNAVSSALGMFALVSILGVGELSIFYLASSSYSVLWGLLNLGLASVATSRISASLRAGETGRMTGWVGVILRLSLILSATALVLGVVFLPSVVEFFIDENGARIGSLSAMMMLIPLLDVPRVVCCAAMQAERRMHALARVDMGQELCRLLFVVSGALALGTALGPVLGTLAASVAGSLLALDAYGRERRSDGSVLPKLSKAIGVKTVPVRLALREGAKIGIVRNIDSLGTQNLPTLILGSMGDQKWVAYLRVAQRMITMARLFMQGINRTALPALSQLAGVKDLVGLRRLYWRASFYSGVAITLGLLVTMPILPFIIRAVLREEYWDPVWQLSLILAPGLAIVSFSVANDIFYLVTGQMKVAIIISLIGLVVNTTLLALLVYFFPRIGAALGLTFTCLFSQVHLGYAWYWFRKNDHLFLREQPDGVVAAGVPAVARDSRS
jgi:O-antigen/teichoic acid export membrane protein